MGCFRSLETSDKVARLYKQPAESTLVQDGRFAVVIPALNEAATIRDLAERAAVYCNPVIVVDDGSSDGTAECLTDLPITLLRHSSRQGKAASLMQGIRSALTQPVAGVITLDGDGQHQPEDIPKLLAATQRAPGNIVIGARDIGIEAIPPARLFANRFANFWISWACGYPVRDSQSGFRLYPRSILERVAACHEPNHGFVFESEILINAAQAGYRSVPVSIRALYSDAAPRPSHFRPALDIWRITAMVAKKLLSRGLYIKGLIRMLRTWSTERQNTRPASVALDTNPPQHKEAAPRHR